jgi:hypothetical protein
VQQRKESASLLTNARLYGWLRSSSSVTSGKKETFLKTTHSQLKSRLRKFRVTICMSGKPLKAKRQSDGNGSASGGGAAAVGGSAAGAGDDVHYDDSRLLPIANTSRIMKTALPPNAKISREGVFSF